MRTARLEAREAFQASRGVAILIVVIFHADLALANLPSYETFTTVRDALRFIPMPLFFLSVGMSLAPAFERGNASSHLARRAVHYGYLFVVWTVIDLAIGAAASLGHVPPLSLIKAFLHPDSGLWFLYGLAAQLVLFGLLASCSRYVQITLALMLVFVSSYAHSALMTGTAGYMIFLVVGARYAPLLQRLIAKASRWAILLYAGAYATLSWLIGAYHPILGVFIAIAASIIGIVGMTGLFRWLMHWKKLRLLRYLGRSTFEIYILHTYFVIAFAKATIWFNVNVQGSTLLEFPLTLTALTIGVCGSLLVSYCIRNVKWLFSKPHWVVAGVEPAFVRLIDNIAHLIRHRRDDRLQSSGVRLG